MRTTFNSDKIASLQTDIKKRDFNLSLLLSSHKYFLDLCLITWRFYVKSSISVKQREKNLERKDQNLVFFQVETKLWKLLCFWQTLLPFSFLIVSNFETKAGHIFHYAPLLRNAIYKYQRRDRQIRLCEKNWQEFQIQEDCFLTLVLVNFQKSSSSGISLQTGKTQFSLKFEDLA